MNNPTTDQELRTNLEWCNSVEFQRWGNSDGSVSVRRFEPAHILSLLDRLESAERRAEVAENGLKDLASRAHAHLANGRAL